jgi:hypothetical protein
MNTKKHKLFEVWLSSSTCKTVHYNAVKHSIVLENDDYIIFKHGSHSSYIDRMTGSKTCKAYYVMFNKNSSLSDIKEECNFIKKWYGRISISKLRLIIEEEFKEVFVENYISDEWYFPEKENYVLSQLAFDAKNLKNVDYIKL